MNIEKKRFILFTFDHYYPSGGTNDATHSFDNLIEYKQIQLEILAKENWERPDYFNILDVETFAIYESRNKFPIVDFN